MKPRGSAPVLRPAAPLAYDAGAASIAELAGALPAPASLEPGSWLELGPAARRARSWFRAARGPGPETDLALRCSALLLRGYVEICAEGELAWGRVPARDARPTG